MIAEQLLVAPDALDPLDPREHGDAHGGQRQRAQRELEPEPERQVGLARRRYLSVLQSCDLLVRAHERDLNRHRFANGEPDLTVAGSAGPGPPTGEPRSASCGLSAVVTGIFAHRSRPVMGD